MRDSKFLLYEDFIIRTPAHHLIYSNLYFEYYRQFKYHDYIISKPCRLLKNCKNLKEFLINRDYNSSNSYSLHISFNRALMNNKILFYRVYRYGSHPYSTEAEMDSKLILRKMYLNIIHLLNYISVYAKLLKSYKLFTKSYMFRLAYRSYFDFKTFYYYSPAGICFSTQHFYKRLLLSRFDYLTYTINYFIIDRLKIIDLDVKINLYSSKIL